MSAEKGVFTKTLAAVKKLPELYKPICVGECSFSIYMISKEDNVKEGGKKSLILIGINC